MEALDNLIHTPLPASLINSSSEEGIELFNTVQPNLAFKVRIQSAMSGYHFCSFVVERVVSACRLRRQLITECVGPR